MHSVLLLGWALAATILPVFRLPAPDGRHAVGTTVLPGMVQLWYPSTSASGPLAPYAPEGAGPIRHAGTQAILGAPVAPGRHPLLIYVHAWGGTRWENTGLLQRLASHGYLVAAADQPSAPPGQLDDSSPQAWARTEGHAAAMLAEQVAAARALIDRLTGFGSMVADNIDRSRLGIIGYSFGGAVAAELGASDPRLSAAVNMDGLLFGTARAIGVSIPYLELSDDEPPTHAPPGADLARRTAADVRMRDDAAMRAGLARNGGTLITIAGTLHANFSDLPLLIPFRGYTGAGPINPEFAGKIIGEAVLGFLDAHLAGAPARSLARFSEVREERWPTPGAAPAAAPR